MKNGKLKIESGIAIPAHRGRDQYMDAMREMKVGESFLFPLAKRNNIGGYGRSLGMKFTTRAVDDETCRVWRVE